MARTFFETWIGFGTGNPFSKHSERFDNPVNY